MIRHISRTLALFFVLTQCVWAQPPEYKRQPGVAGKLVSVGSDTMANLVELWAENFEFLYPQTRIEVTATGSSTAPPALIEGVASIGAMSRALKASETRAFEKKYGYKPLVLKVALDAIAIFVASKNPLQGITLQEVDAIYSSTRFCGGQTNISRWNQLGISDENMNREIRLYGRNSVSGTYGAFKKLALCHGDFSTRVNEMPGSASVVLSVAASERAIGYSAFGYKTAGVRALAVGDSKDNLIPLTLANVRTEKYPLSRFLYLVVNKDPDRQLATLELEFLRFVLSANGQELVSQDGYFPIKDDLATRQTRALSEDIVF